MRLLAEYLGPMRIFRQKRIKDTIVFFGSARIPSPEEVRKGKRSDPASPALKSLVRYYEEARQLSYRLTKWSKGLGDPGRRFIITSGGGGGIMEAASRGATEAGGYAIGMNISLPHEQEVNRFVTPDLNLEFHYFFMRKFWLLYLAKALVVFPGGFGTLDELFELLTLIQTKKMRKKLPVVIYGKAYWERVIRMDYLRHSGTISAEDMELFHYSSTVDDAYGFLTRELTKQQVQGKNF